MKTLTNKVAATVLAGTAALVAGVADAKIMPMQACLNEIVHTWGGDNGCNAYGSGTNGSSTMVVCHDGAVGQVYMLSFHHGAWHCNAGPVLVD